MAIKITNTTVIDNSRNLTNIQNFSSSGIATIAGSVKISSGIVTAVTGIITYFGDGSQLSGVSAGGGGSVLSVGRRSGIASISVSSGSTTLLLRTGITTTIPV
jgi:hypothetical protein